MAASGRVLLPLHCIQKMEKHKQQSWVVDNLDASDVSLFCDDDDDTRRSRNFVKVPEIADEDFSAIEKNFMGLSKNLESTKQDLVEIKDSFKELSEDWERYLEEELHDKLQELKEYIDYMKKEYVHDEEEFQMTSRETFRVVMDSMHECKAMHESSMKEEAGINSLINDDIVELNKCQRFEEESEAYLIKETPKPESDKKSDLEMKADSDAIQSIRNSSKMKAQGSSSSIPAPISNKGHTFRHLERCGQVRSAKSEPAKNHGKARRRPVNTLWSHIEPKLVAESQHFKKSEKTSWSYPKPSLESKENSQNIAKNSGDFGQGPQTKTDQSQGGTQLPRRCQPDSGPQTYREKIEQHLLMKLKQAPEPDLDELMARGIALIKSQSEYFDSDSDSDSEIYSTKSSISYPRDVERWRSQAS